MRKARPVRPTDLVSLVSFDGTVYPNEAHTWDRLGRGAESPRLLEKPFEQLFSFATGRHTWISVQGQTIRGIASARQRGSRLAWEIDCFIIAADEAEPICFELLEQVCRAAVQSRALRVFLRAEAGSDVVPAARKCGFMPLTREALFELPGETLDVPLAPELELRERQRTDGFGLFRLYNLVTPLTVRQQEAMTYTEWIAGQEKRSRGRGRLDLVAVRDGELVGWLRAEPDGEHGRIDVLTHPEASDATPGLVAHAVRALGERRPIYALAPSYLPGLATILEEAGFRQHSDYLSLVKRLVVPAKVPALVRVATAHQPLTGALIAPSRRTWKT